MEETNQFSASSHDWDKVTTRTCPEVLLFSTQLLFASWLTQFFSVNNWVSSCTPLPQEINASLNPANRLTEPSWEDLHLRREWWVRWKEVSMKTPINHFLGLVISSRLFLLSHITRIRPILPRPRAWCSSPLNITLASGSDSQREAVIEMNIETQSTKWGGGGRFTEQR